MTFSLSDNKPFQPHSDELPVLFSVMRRNPFGVDICCRKGSRSPLQELYNPIQVRPQISLLL
jgi:hypothetical protein